MPSRNTERDSGLIALYQKNASYYEMAQYLGVDVSRARNIVAGVVNRAKIPWRNPTRSPKVRIVRGPLGRPRKERPDIIGQTFGELTVISEAGKDHGGNRMVRVRCSCGREKVIQAYNVERGFSQGCYHPKERRA